MRRTVCLFALLILVTLHAFASAHEPFDDCDADFIAFIGSNTYQFSPLHRGDLGTVRLFSILSYQRVAAEKDFGLAFWRLEIRGPAPADRTVLVQDGRSRIDDRGAALAEFVWDGRDDRGDLVEPGRYQYTFLARYLPDRMGGRIERPSFERLGLAFDEIGTRIEIEEAYASTDEVIVDLSLSEDESLGLRLSALNTACELQQNVPIEPGFGFNYYYGSTHSHSNFSDGGQPTTGCSSGNAYGSGSFDPAAVYDFARNTAGMDFWLVNEHNHLIENSITTNNPPLTPTKVVQRYQDGRNAAAAATVDGAFVGLYGMEWGVSSNADQGHVTLIETPVLFGWEPCTNCNGPNPECTPGADCYFDVFTPKRFGYLTMYQRSVENPSPVGSLGAFCHPGSGNFDNFAFDANADEAMQGIAVRSGLAFSTANDCASANVGSTDYSSRWRTALDRGFHLGPVADHDSHCNNFGVAIPTRTVYLVPNGVTPALTKTNILQAHKSRHFFATEDSNAQLVFATSDNAHIMGDDFGVGASVTLRAAVHDPDAEAVTTIEIWRGQIGAGALTAPYLTGSGSTINLTENLSSGTYYYFVHAVQADGHDLWSAPMWITYGAATCSDSDVPSVSIVSPTEGSNVSGVVTVQVAASDASCGIATVEVAIDGGAWNLATFNGATGYYEYSWNSGQSCAASATISARATDQSSPANVGTATPVGVTITNNDITPPAVSIASPAQGATITCANTTVQVSATDASGIATVEISIDGGAWSGATFNAASGYWEYAWASSSASAGGHSIDARATDGSCNANSASATQVTVTVQNDCGADVSNWKITQANSARDFFLPTGTNLPGGTYVIVARNATQAAFESFWGVTLGANVTYINSGNSMPVINGSETYALSDAVGALVDGTTIAMAGSGNQSIQRSNACGAASNASSWGVGNTATATPGTGAPASCGAGIVISEFSDATGTGNYIYEFVELYNDAAGPPSDTEAPVTSITAPADGSLLAGVVNVTASASDNVGVTGVEFLLDGIVQSTDTTAPYEWTWDTTVDADGPHTITSRASDAAGNSASSAGVSVTVDNEPPTTAITSPANGATVSGTIVVTGSASDNFSVDVVEFLLDGVVQATDTTAPYGWTWDTTLATDGSHSLSSRATDSAGNLTTSASVTVTVANAVPDSEPPTTAITSPANGSLVNGTVAVAATASDNVGVTSVEFLLDGIVQSTDTTVPYEWSWNTTASSDGTHSLTSRAADAAGNVTTSIAVAVTVDNTAPATSVTSPANGATVSGSIVVTASASDASGVASVEFLLDGIVQSTDTVPPYEWTWNTATASDGTHMLASRASDSVGNLATSASVSVTADNTAPSTSITSPTNGATVNGTILVAASASDGIGVTSVEFLLDGVVQATDTTAPYEWNWDTTTVSDGAHSLTSRASDGAGFSTTSTAVSVTVDNTVPDTTPPAVSIVAPTNGANISGVVLIQVSASDASGITSVDVSIDGGAWQTTTFNGTSGFWELGWDATAHCAPTATIDARASDGSPQANVGNATQVGVNVTADCGFDLSGWKVVQQNSAQELIFPAGTFIAGNGYLVIGRDATQAAFEAFWAITLGANVTYIDSLNSMPIINGDESYALYDDLGNLVDGFTIATQTSAGQSIQRVSPCSPASSAASWNVASDATATPGSGVGSLCGGGMVINEFSDASGTGNFVYEFIELFYDAFVPPPDTETPSTSITSPSNGAIVSGSVVVTASATDNVGVTSVEFLLDGMVQSTDTAEPWEWAWDTTTATNGAHTLESRAFDAAGNNAVSTTVTVNVDNAVADTDPPTAPANLTVSQNGKRKLLLVWDASSDNVGVVEYQIYRATSAGGPFTQVGTSTSTSHLDTGLSSRTRYYYYVTASDAAGNVSAPSNTANQVAR